MVYKFFDRKSTDSGIKLMSNQQLADELHKPVIRKLKRRKVFADMQLISKWNIGIRFLLCVIDLFSIYL